MERASGARLIVLALLSAAPLRAQLPAPEPFVVRHAALDVTLELPANRLHGTMTLEMQNWTAAPARRVSLLLNRLMEADAVTGPSGTRIPFAQDVVRFEDQPLRQVTQLVVHLPQPVEPGGRATISVRYAGNLVGYTEVGWLYVRDRIDTSFTLLRADALAFPEIAGINREANRRGPSEDFTYDVAVRVPPGFVVATGGRASREVHQDGSLTWRYVSEGASPFLNVAVARFDTLSGPGVRLFHFPEDSVGARRLLANAGAAIRLLTEWFGPRRGDATLTIIEIPEGWGSQASLVGGIIQSAAAFRDSARTGEMYHELTHLWNVQDTDAPSPRWNEGLASFLEGLLYERINGWSGRRAYGTRYLAWLRDRVAKDTTLRRVPFIDYGVQGMTDHAYGVGALMFGTLFELVGQREFNAIVGGYYQAFPTGGTTRDFVAHAQRVSPVDLTPFFHDWLFTTRWTDHVVSAGSPEELARRYRGGTGVSR